MNSSFLEKEKKNNNPETDNIKEGRKEVPPIVDIFYTFHKDAVNLEGLQEKIRDADIFVPEMLGWSDKIKRAFRNVAEGKLTPQQFMERGELNEENFKKYYMERGELNEKDFKKFYNVWLEQLNALYNTKKEVVFLDVREDSKLHQEFKREPILEDLLEGKTFEERLAVLDEYLKRDVELQKFREDRILKRLQSLLKESSGEGSTPKKILLSLGSYHSGIFHSLKRAGVNVSREYGNMPHVFDFITEAQREYNFGKKASPELLTHALAQYLLEDAISKLDLGEVPKRGKFMRTVISLLSNEEIKSSLNDRSLLSSKKELFKILVENLQSLVK